MEYSIKILQENLDRLNSRYEKFVSNGPVEITSIIALDNREKARDLQQAITELNQALQLQQTGVISRREQLIAFLREQNKLHYITIYENDFDFADKLLKAINCL